MVRIGRTFVFVFSFLASLATGSAHADPRILLIYGSVGMGHKAAADAAAADILRKNPKAVVEVKDLRDFMNPVLKKPGNQLYDVMTQSFPEWYDKFFRDYGDVGTRVKSIGEMPLTKEFNPKKVLEWVENWKPDVIISTFPSATQVLVYGRDRGRLRNVPIGWVHTDLVDETVFARMPLQTEMAFVGIPSMEKSWVRRGVPADRVIASGMPLNPLVYEDVDPKAVEAFMAEKGLRADRKKFLVLGGSNGVGDYPAMVESIAEKFKGEPIQIVAVCGRNETHMKNLAKMKDDLARRGVDLIIEPLIKQPVLFKYMESADFISSKTGGLTPMELFVKLSKAKEAGLKPKGLILLDINGGQERYNANVFAEEDLAVLIKNEKNIGEDFRRLANDPALIEKQVARQTAFRDYNQPGKVADWALSKPKAKEMLHEKVFLATEPDYPRPRGFVFDCLRMFRKPRLKPNVVY